jgi:hypothetical protein
MVNVDGKIIHFGERGYSDMTKHKDPKRKQRYIDRHAKQEDWTKSGIQTPGFWSRWLLWNKPTLEESKQDVQKRFGITVR